MSYLSRIGSLRSILAIGAMLIAASAGTNAAAQSAGPAENPRAGQTFSECRNCPEMIVLPAGSYLMGSPEDEPLRRENEKQRRITFAEPFAMSRTPVTWDQWEACVRDAWCDGVGVEQALTSLPTGERNPNFVDQGRGTRPVVGVSWFDAQNFVGWLNFKAGVDDLYHLPSEAEWEYGARGGSTSAFWWGPELDYDYGNFGQREDGLGGQAEGRDEWVDSTSPVASFPPNDFGLYDMHGNIFEWVDDCYEEDLSNAPTDGSANKNGNCANRVFRSGTYLSNPYMQRTARRGAPYVATQRGRNYLGFRVSRTLE